MKCYNCGCTLSENDFCTGCGADVLIYKKIMRLSNIFYNDGLKKAQVRDLTGAAQSLRQSLKCNKNNIDARNLLGLVFFEMGEPVAALSEWVISKNIKSKKNIADDFIQEIQSNPTKLDAINQTIKKYNQALMYCKQGSFDLAAIQLKKVLSINPNLIKAYQLLALLYTHNEEWEKAKRTIVKAAKIDANNTTTLYYIREIDKMLEVCEEPGVDKKKKKPLKSDVITYQSGNETIIQPLNGPEKTGGATVVNLVIGMIIGLGIMWFLILPSRVQAEKSDINKNLVEVSDQLTAKSATIEELEKRVEALQTENSDLQADIEGYTGSDGVLKASDFLMEASKKYIEDPDAVLDIADIMKSIDEDYVEGTDTSEEFKALYSLLHTEVSTKAAVKYLQTGLSALKKNDYVTAISDLTKAYETDETNVESLYNLAHAYRKSGNTDKADELYRQVISLFPDSQYANNAKGYITENTETADNANTQQQPQVTDGVAPTVTEPTLPIVDATNPLGVAGDNGAVQGQ